MVSRKMPRQRAAFVCEATQDPFVVNLLML